MSDGVVVGGQGAGLSQVERVVDTFIAPSKTFTDILRSTSWWLPFLLLVVVSLGATVVVDKQVGFERVVVHGIGVFQIGRHHIESARDISTAVQSLENNHVIPEVTIHRF